MTRFALIGAGGYIAPKHMEAIKNVGGDLVRVLDPNDSIGVIDQYFPNARYYSEQENFDAELMRDQMYKRGVDYVAIASPNYLHKAHIKLALNNNAHAICEKPLVLNPKNLDVLEELEKRSGKKVFPILQLRLHPAIISFKNDVSLTDSDYEINLEYITPRGSWYNHSWKGNPTKSGGISTNIGIHLFDMLIWVFGEVKSNELYYQNAYDAKGKLRLERATVNWHLSINKNDLPHNEWKAYRSITVNGKEIDFSDGFTELHTKSYEEILNGKGFSIADTRPSIELVSDLRRQFVNQHPQYLQYRD